jgi:hypothetical protein
MTYSVWPSKPVTVLHGCYGPLQLFRKGDWFIGETDLLACYDLFWLHPVWKTRRGQGHQGRQVCSFPKMWILLTCITVIKCLQKGVAGPLTKENNHFRSSTRISGEQSYSRRSLCDWLVLNAWWIWLVKISQLEMNSCLGERPLIQILLGGWSDAPARYQPSGTWHFKLIRGRRHWAALQNSSVLHFESLKFDNIKGPYFSMLAKEVVLLIWAVDRLQGCIFRFPQLWQWHGPDKS